MIAPGIDPPAWRRGAICLLFHWRALLASLRAYPGAPCSEGGRIVLPTVPSGSEAASRPSDSFRAVVPAMRSAVGGLGRFQQALRNYRSVLSASMVNRHAPIATRVAGGRGRRGDGWIAESGLHRPKAYNRTPVQGIIPRTDVLQNECTVERMYCRTDVRNRYDPFLTAPGL